MSFVEALRSFDSHERGILLQWATGLDFDLSEQMRHDLRRSLNLEIPPRAFVAMDYTLDWLYAAATRYLQGVDVPPVPTPWPEGSQLKASIEDIDLVVAWDDERPRLLLLEAKGFTGWSNKQLLSKVQRLDEIFDERTRTAIDVRLVLVGPKHSAGVTTSEWPTWLLDEGRYRFLTIPSPGDRYAVQRCLETGVPAGKNFTHWRVIPRKWG